MVIRKQKFKTIPCRYLQLPLTGFLTREVKINGVLIGHKKFVSSYTKSKKPLHQVHPNGHNCFVLAFLKKRYKAHLSFHSPLTRPALG